MSSSGVRRISLIDALRGLAIIGVVIYHLVWDLRFLQFTQSDPIFDPFWLALAKVLLAAFLVLTGISLVLAHGKEIRWRSFWRRFGILAGASLLVSVGTYIGFQNGFVYFGVLHAIALFSLMGLAFLRVPIWLVVAIGAAFIALPFMAQSDAFNVRYLSWIGFWTVPPYTQDLVPIFPGFGFTLFGVAAMRLVRDFEWTPILASADLHVFWYRWLVWAGRWSLVIYLAHQLILTGILFPLAEWIKPGAEVQAMEFYNSCTASCEIGDGSPQYCAAYCSCSLEMVELEGLWEAIRATEPTSEQMSQANGVAQLCRAMSTPALELE